MKGICFIERLHAKVIDCSKTQTRRIITPQPKGNYISKEIEGNTADLFNNGKGLSCTAFFTKDIKVKSRYNLGETVFLKEPYFIYEEKNLELKTRDSFEVAYKYKNNNLSLEEITGIENAKWKNKLFMPEYASKFRIRITNIKIERLQDISDDDCLREGITHLGDVKHGDEIFESIYFNPIPYYNKEKKKTLLKDFDSPRKAYADLIDSINGKGTWESNPWVFVYDFCLCDTPYCDYGK